MFFHHGDTEAQRVNSIYLHPDPFFSVAPCLCGKRAKLVTHSLSPGCLPISLNKHDDENDEYIFS